MLELLDIRSAYVDFSLDKIAIEIHLIKLDVDLFLLYHVQLIVFYFI